MSRQGIDVGYYETRVHIEVLTTAELRNRVAQALFDILKQYTTVTSVDYEIQQKALQQCVHKSLNASVVV